MTGESQEGTPGSRIPSVATEKTVDLADDLVAEFGENANYVGDLLARYRASPESVDEEWRLFFQERLGPSAPAPAPSAPPVAPPSRIAPPAPIASPPPPAATGEPLRGGALRIAENMEASLAVPTATSQRQIPIKLADENRRLINEYRAADDESKISFTHLFGWAIVEALRSFPRINDAYDVEGGTPVRRKREEVRLGLAVDVEKSDGSRTLARPQREGGREADLPRVRSRLSTTSSLARAKGRSQISDFEGTTVSLTNPGTLGTTASVPRLMPGQAVIVATGAIGYPAEFAAMAPETIAQLAVSKVVTFTSTYDHRIIQGAESGAVPGRIEELLLGKDGFYETLFADLGIPHKPFRWAVDRNPAFGRRDEISRSRRRCSS